MFKLIPNSVWRVLQEDRERTNHALAQAWERIDRLTEALSHKNDVPLYMPLSATREQLIERAQQGVVLEKSAGWYDTKPIPVVTKTGGTK
jgi:hypothetical protein